MEAVLSQLNSVPGVIGCMACDTEARSLVRAFPSLFDPAMLESAAGVIGDGAAGLDLASGQAELLEFRFAEANLLVKPIPPRGVLVVLTGKGTNVHFLGLSISLAAAKIAKLHQVADRATPAPVVPPAHHDGAPPPIIAAAPKPASSWTAADHRAVRPPIIGPVPAPAPQGAAPEAAADDGDASQGKRVAPPTKGLDALRRRLAGAKGIPEEPRRNLTPHAPMGDSTPGTSDASPPGGAVKPKKS